MDCKFLQKTFLKACLGSSAYYDDIKKVKACIELGVDVHVKLEKNMISDGEFLEEAIG